MYNLSPWQAISQPVNQAMSSFYGSAPVRATTGFTKGVLSMFNPIPELKSAYNIAEEKGAGAIVDPGYWGNIGLAATSAVPIGKFATAGIKGGIPAVMDYGRKFIGGKFGKGFIGLGGAMGAEQELNKPSAQAPMTSYQMGTLGASPYGLSQNQSGQVLTDIQRTNPLTGEKFTTQLAGDKYVLLERPNPLRPSEMTQTYVTESSIKGGLPTGSKIAGYGYQVQRPSPLTGKLENTIISEKDLVNLGGTPVRGAGVPSSANGFDISRLGQGAYNSAMGAANSEFALGKKAAQRDLRTILQQLGQAATGSALDTSMAAAQAGMDTSPGALDVSLDYIQDARARGEAGARGDFAKVVGQLEQRRLRQQAAAAQSRNQFQQNAMLNLFAAQLGLL